VPWGGAGGRARADGRAPRETEAHRHTHTQKHSLLERSQYPISFHPSPPCLSLSLRSAARAALATARVPTPRTSEAFRQTDISPITTADLAWRGGGGGAEGVERAAAAAGVDAAFAALHALPGAAATLVLLDGLAVPSLCSGLGARTDGAYAGCLAGAPPLALGSLGRAQAAATAAAAAANPAASGARGGSLFASLNAAATGDVAVVYAGADTTIEGPVHILFVSTGGGGEGSPSPASIPAAAPRLLVALAPGATAAVVEEFVTAPSSSTSSQHSFTSAVAEVELGAGAALEHGYVQAEGRATWHAKQTLVTQAAQSRYAFVEARIGGAFSRGEVDVVQTGPATHTSLRSFLLAGPDQAHDLHSRLELDHPDGTANQLHKCIAASPTSRAVFDGSVRVGRAAQRTDAAQLSRNLLLAKRALVHARPNLQIIADDVKCTHGCAVSDLDAEALFYFRSRGVDAAAARAVLVASFGAEVVAGLPSKELRGRVEAACRASLAEAGVPGVVVDVKAE